ncbi:hypothetical protein HY405_00655 [Candidatus Microgenomates bacterium]|nr:hypothetical protein [Candidatus Microgenomates bacterium]
MPLGPKKLLSLVKKKKLVEGLSGRELTNPEGAGFDLRVGEVYKIKGKGYLGIDERKTPDALLVKKYKNGTKASITLKPGDYYLVKTIESVNLPENIGATLFTRGTLFRSGIIHGLSQIAPGYKGELITSLANLGPCSVEIELGSRFMHIQFVYVEGGGSLYRGQWQGGRVAATKRERQV